MNKGKGKLEEIAPAGPSGVGQGSGYQLRIHIIEARDLKGRDASGQSDPVCVVSALGKKDKTVIHKKTTICVWDHLFIWEFPKMGENEFLGGTVQVDVYDANTLMRNEMIGRFEINLGYVYKTEGHEVYRRWVALADPTDKFEGVQGYLRLSVTALSANDVAPVHTEDEEEDEEQNSTTNLQAMVLLPPSIQVEERMLNVRIYSVEGLPKLDTFGTCDPFVQAKFAGLTIKTETKDKQQNATFNENLQIPVNIPVMAEEIQVTVWDFDAVGKNEIIATVLIKFSEVQEGKWNTPRWVNLYGSPYPEESRKIKEMNFGFVEASAYRGRLLLSLDSQPTKDGKLAKVPIGPPTAPPNREYVAFLDLFEGAKLDTDESNVDVELTVGSQTIFSKKAKVGKENKAIWYENVQPLQLSLPMDIAQCPDIFINVFRHVPLLERKRVGLLRISAQEAYDNSRSEPKWFLLSRDILIDGTKFSGFLLAKLAFIPAIETIPRSPVDHPVLKKYQLRAFIYQAKNLFAADDNGLSDPYCVVHLGGVVHKTKIEKETVFPQWYESLALDVQLPENLNIAPSISILLYDHDMFSADDLLGLVHVPITSVTAAIQPPKWYSLFLNNQDFGKNLRGELLASFQLLPAEQADTPLPNIKPASRDASIDFGIIGMRNLLPYALQPIQNSYVEIRCGRDAAVRTKPSKKPSGSNPNFLENLEIPVKLPDDPIYSPVVEVKVFDNRIIYKPLIGATSIDIDRLIPWAKIQNEVEEIPDNAEVPQAPVEEVALAPEGAEEKVPSATIVDIQEPISPDSSGWFEGKDGKGKAPGVEMSSGPLLQQNDEIHIAIEDGPKNPNEELANSGSDASQPLLGGKKKDFQITLPNMALRTLASVQDKIPLGLEVMEKEAEEEASNTGGVPRPRVQKELERYYKPSFDTWNLFKGKQAGLGLIKKPSYTVSGQLKGQLRVNDGTSEHPLSLQELFQPLPYVLRLYVLRGIGLNPKDANGLCDPYVVIYTNGANGRKLIIKDIEEMKKETLNPNFFKCYEINATLPGDSELEIEVWDWDQVGGDDLVGSTVIDLENRQFSQEWRQLDPKPIEARRLSSPLSSNSQGQLELWLDIMTPSEAAATPKIEISPPLPRNFELRMVIWNTKEVTFKDAKMSDIFVVGYIEGKEPQKTDIHWRSEDGDGMFNWRMVFPVTLPYKNPRLKIQIWDKDLLNPNDVIAEASLNLRSFFRKAFKDRNKTMHSVERQFITLTHPNFPGPQGRVEISIDMILEEEARKNPVGLGRNDPNHSPHLPKPDRPDTSFNPLNPMSYLSKVLWKQNKGKVICICVCICVVILFPVILFIVNSITKFI